MNSTNNESNKKYMDRFVVFHIGRGGRYFNPGYKTCINYDKSINDLLSEDEGALGCHQDEAEEEWLFDTTGEEVGLEVDNDGTGIVEIDGDYDTLIVKRFKDCTRKEVALFYVAYGTDSFLNQILPERVTIFEKFGISPFDFLEDEGGFVVFDLEYSVKSLEELGIEEITKEEYDVDSDNYEYEENYEKFYRMEKE